MSNRMFIISFLLVALTVHTTPQFIDFFQGFNSFLQPYQPQNVQTKKPATSRHTTKPSRYDDIIFFGTDEVIKEKAKNSATTTVKPRKSSQNTKSRIQTTTKSWIDLLNPNSKVINYDSNGRIDNHNSNNGNHNVNSGRNGNHNSNNGRTGNLNVNNERIDVNWNNYDILNYNNRRTTEKPRNYDRTTHSSNFRPNHHSYTTRNPLLNRPGVKPAVVDENRPPITNKPVTDIPFYERPEFNRPYERPTERPYERPTERPYERPYERPTERPIFEKSTSRPRDKVTSRPNYEKTTSRPARPTEKPIWSGGTEDEEPEIEIGPDEDDMSEVQKKRFIDMAEQKCNEYKSMKQKKIVALPLAPSSQGVEVNVSSCPKTNVPLIIGGKVVTINEFPHMSLVGWKKVQANGYSWKCGGSLISERFILTAGHCTYHDKDYNVVSGPPHAVQLGSSYLDDSTATVIKISAVIRHPKYKLRRSYHDVALIKLTVSVTFSDVISPACLGVPPPVGDPIIATGWGKTEYGGDSSLELRSVSIPIWDMNECREIWGTSRKLPNGPSPDNQLCAGEKSGGKDTCQGDSGGPAQVQDGCLWRVVAVTSVGRSCGAPDTPALYARLPRAFISSQAFTNINNHNNNDNRFNNNNGNVNNGYNNNRNNEYNNNNGNDNRYNNNRNNEYNRNENNRNEHGVNNDNRDNRNTNNGYNNNGYNINNNANYEYNNNRNNGYNGNIGNEYYNYNSNQNYNNGYENNNKFNNVVAISRPITTTTQRYNNRETQYNGNNRYNNNGYNDNTRVNNEYQYTTEGFNGFPIVANRPWWSR